MYEEYEIETLLLDRFRADCGLYKDCDDLYLDKDGNIWGDDRMIAESDGLDIPKDWRLL